MIFVIVPVVFWLFVAALCITAVVSEYKTRRNSMDTIRLAIERGQELSPELLAQLSSFGKAKARPAGFLVAGIIVMSVGIGAAVVGLILLISVPVAVPFIFAGAGFVISVGLGLFITAKLLRKHSEQQGSVS